MEKSRDSIGSAPRSPKRLYLSLCSDGTRVRLVDKDGTLGGSYLMLFSFLRDLANGKRMEVYFTFVPDSSRWRDRVKTFTSAEVSK